MRILFCSDHCCSSHKKAYPECRPISDESSMSRAWVWLVGALAIIGAAQLGQSVTRRSARALKARASQRRETLQTAAGNSLPLQNGAETSASARAQVNGSLLASSQDVEERLASNANASTSSSAEPQLPDPLQGQCQIRKLQQRGISVPESTLRTSL